MIMLIVETMRHANEKSHGVGMKNGLQQEIHLYANVVDGYREALGKVMRREEEATSLV